MKKNKTFTINTILSFAAAALFAFAGCANMEDGAQFALAKAPSAGTDGGSQIADGSGGQGGAGQSGLQEPVIITVSGSLDFGGAFPEQIAALVDNSLAASQSAEQGGEGVARSAFPGTPALSGLTYSVYALEELPDGSTDTPLRYDGTVADDNSSYTVGIPVTSGKKYYVYANAANSDGFALLSGKSAVLDFTTITSFKTDVNIALGAAQSTTGKGLVSLEVNVDCAEIDHARVWYIPTGAGSSRRVLPASKDGSKYTFNIGYLHEGDFVDAVQSGAHTMTFDFIPEDNSRILYSFTESVNVFDNMTTNKWVKNGAEPWLTPDSSGNIACKITDAMVTGFTLTDIYVDPSKQSTTPNAEDGSYTTASGTFLNPKTSFDAALAMLRDASADYTIHIKGTIGPQTIEDTLKNSGSGGGNTYAKSLTLCGVRDPEDGVPTDSIDADGAAGKSALLIKTTVPITIKNLKITGGTGTVDGTNIMGGGIFLKATSGSLTLASGAYVYGNTAKIESLPAEKKGRGAGICLYPACRLNILDGAVIENNESDGQGGGIFCKRLSGNSPHEITMSGGHIRGNKADLGGALNMEYGTFTMTGGVIGDDSTSISQAARKSGYSNTARLGGAIYSSGSGSDNFNIYLLGGTIAYNYAKSCGGAFYLSGGNMTVKNAKIQYNGAGDETGGLADVGYGGALSFERYGNLHLEDCSIIGNECYERSGGEAKGGAICVLGPSDASTTPNIYLKGSVSIPSDGRLKNDIVLQKSSSSWEYPALTIEGKLTGSGKIARLTPTSADYDENRVVLKLASSVTDTSLAQECYKFDVTPQASPAQEWAVGTDGKLAKLTTLTADNIESFMVADFNEGDKVVIRVDSTVLQDQVVDLYKKFFNKNANTDEKKVAEGSLLDFSKASASITYLAHNSEWSGGVVWQPFSIILPPNAEGNLFWDMDFAWSTKGVKNFIATADSTWYLSEDGIVYSKNKKTLYFYPGGKTATSFVVPDGVTVIEDYAFAYDSSLTSVTLPAGLLTLGQSAFYGNAIESLVIPASVTRIEYQAFGYGTSHLASVVFENPNGWYKNSISDANLIDSSKLNVPGDGEGSTLKYIKDNGIYNSNPLIRDPNS